MTDSMRSLQGMRAARPGGKLALLSLVGATTASLLLIATPAHESGRTVAVSFAEDGTAKLRHISGPQYLRAYRDIVGIPTACDGITRGVKMGQTFTEAQCAAMLEGELIIHAQGVMNCTPGLAGAGRDNQRYAAVSLAYNVGVAAYCKSTTARRFNAGQYRLGCDALLMWNKAGGRVVRGLQRRRETERAICLKGIA